MPLKKHGVVKEGMLECKCQEILQEDEGMCDEAYRIRGF